jgi:hypothetical protein
MLWRAGVSLRWYQGINLSGFSMQAFKFMGRELIILYDAW